MINRVSDWVKKIPDQTIQKDVIKGNWITPGFDEQSKVNGFVSEKVTIHHEQLITKETTDKNDTITSGDTTISEH